ncbi:MAG: SDR family oxidoreductase [Candidatus Limnocylindrales bacterium]
MARHAVTGALGFSGRHITARLLARGDAVINLTNHPDRPDPFGGVVPAAPLAFDRPELLATSLDGVDTLFNTYWVRFPRGASSHAGAVRNSRTLFEAARSAGVRRVVHVSIANPDPASHLSYYRGKAQVEAALVTSGVSHAILRPTVLFGDEPILANAIAWLLLRSPVFGIPGDGRYGIQPIAVEDLASLALTAAARDEDLTWDAAGPEILSFNEMVEAIRASTGSRARLVHVPGAVALAAAAVLGRIVDDTLLTHEELEGLSGGLLVSRELPRGTARFTDWLEANGSWLGRRYLSEVTRHFAGSPTHT